MRTLQVKLHLSIEERKLAFNYSPNTFSPSASFFVLPVNCKIWCHRHFIWLCIRMHVKPPKLKKEHFSPDRKDKFIIGTNNLARPFRTF